MKIIAFWGVTSCSRTEFLFGISKKSALAAATFQAEEEGKAPSKMQLTSTRLWSVTYQKSVNFIHTTKTSINAAQFNNDQIWHTNIDVILKHPPHVKTAVHQQRQPSHVHSMFHFDSSYYIYSNLHLN